MSSSYATVFGCSLVLSVGCSGASLFACVDDDSCGPDGRCEDSGYCSFPDDDCDSGQRYGKHSPSSLAGECVSVGGSETSSGSSSTTITTNTTSSTTITTSDTGVTTLADTGEICPDWWDCEWAFRHQLTFDNSAQSEDLAGFPVLVVIDPADGYSQIGDQGQDIRFVDADDATVLAHEVERWQTDGPSFAWVEVPQIDGSSARDHIFVYYGNAAAQDAQDPAQLWSAYRGVWHLGTLIDATQNGNDGVAVSTMTGPAQVADGRVFNGMNSAIDCGSADGIDDMFVGGATVSAWINPASWGLANFGRVIDKAEATASTGGFSVYLASETGNDALRFAHGFDMSPGRWQTEDGSLALDVWQHVAVTYDNGSPMNAPTIYIDGVEAMINVLSGPDGVAASEANLALAIGNRSNDDNRTFEGTIDEVRVADGIRSSEWIAAQQLSMTNTFIDYGREQPSP